MKTPSARLAVFVSLLGLTALTSGCVTPLVWNQTAAHDWQSNPPDRLLYVAPNGQPTNVIVCFDQYARIGRQNETRHAAWSPSLSTNSLLAVGHSVDRLTNRFACSQPMPLFYKESDCTNHATAPPGYGVWHCQERQLTIHLDGFPPGPYLLPDSHTETQTVTRIMVVPLAVIADAALACAVALAACGSGWNCY